MLPLDPGFGCLPWKPRLSTPHSLLCSYFEVRSMSIRVQPGGEPLSVVLPNFVQASASAFPTFAETATAREVLAQELREASASAFPTFAEAAPARELLAQELREVCSLWTLALAVFLGNLVSAPLTAFSALISRLARCRIFSLFADYWKKEDPPSIMSFNNVRMNFEKALIPQLKTESAHLGYTVV
ncbi:unnamed protein product [Heligmosomoides polygyrus]|uniref:Transmembrane protein n=1 Tax=Heligmosomoides polygyrus TaxID=6339 RepID=A0A183GTQ9_HELPZ|nr:unnamed protein product [Heligmosomoides polygyrus]